MTIAGNVTVSVGIFSVFVNSNNTLYASGIADSQIQAWPEGSTYPTRNISTDSRFSYAIFVTTDEDIYADRGRGDGLVGQVDTHWLEQCHQHEYQWILRWTLR